MNHQQNRDESVSSTKRMKSSNEANVDSRIEVAFAADPNDKSPPNVFKLNVDCCEELFEYLSLSDLTSFGGTCKRIRQYAGNWFRQNYPHIQIQITKNGIYAIMIIEPSHHIKMNCFSQFIQNIVISHSSFECYRYISSNCNESLKEIEFYSIKIKPVEIECFKGILRKIETIKFIRCEIDGDAFETIFSACDNMKHLSLVYRYERSSEIMIGTSNDWLLHKYPKLEHFELVTKTKIFELPQFFQMNSNICTLSMDSTCLLMNYKYMLESNIKLNVFLLNIYNPNSLNECFQLLNKLYEDGFYERLHLYEYCCVNELDHIDQLVPLKALVKLKISSAKIFTLSTLINLEELYIENANGVADWNELPKKLVNLQRISVYEATSDDIFVFISRATKLNTIKIKDLRSASHYNRKTLVLDVVALNNERRKLNGAQKITIYLDENIYLATKWAFKEIHLSLIELKPFEACLSDELVYYY